MFLIAIVINKYSIQQIKKQLFKIVAYIKHYPTLVKLKQIVPCCRIESKMDCSLLSAY